MGYGIWIHSCPGETPRAGELAPKTNVPQGRGYAIVLGPVRTLMAGSPSNVLVMKGCPDADPGVSVAITCADTRPAGHGPSSKAANSATNSRDSLKYGAWLFILLVLMELPTGSRL